MLSNVISPTTRTLDRGLLLERMFSLQEDNKRMVEDARKMACKLFRFETLPEDKQHEFYLVWILLWIVGSFQYHENQREEYVWEMLWIAIHVINEIYILRDFDNIAPAWEYPDISRFQIQCEQSVVDLLRTSIRQMCTMQRLPEFETIVYQSSSPEVYSLLFGACPFVFLHPEPTKCEWCNRLAPFECSNRGKRCLAHFDTMDQMRHVYLERVEECSQMDWAKNVIWLLYITRPALGCTSIIFNEVSSLYVNIVHLIVAEAF